MKRVPGNRYVVFAVIVCAGATVDLWSKHVVFRDLGYPRQSLAEPAAVMTFQDGRHELFDRPARVEGQSRPYLDGWVKFRLYTSFNSGALWGIGQGRTGIFAVASLAAVIGILVWLFYFGAANSRWLTVSLALIMAGTLGNLWDRLALHGYTDHQGQPIHAVRDFLLFTFGSYNYPIFNLADALLVAGAIMLGVQAFFMPVPSESTEQPPKKQPAAKSSPEKSASATSAV